jgi:hypothetical protein
MATQPSPRRRFQFRLRTLMIVVTVFCVVIGGYTGWQAKIVRDRKAALGEVLKSHGYVYVRTEGTPIPISREGRTISTLRRWMGDSPMLFVIYAPGTPRDEIRRLEELFPEAVVEEAWPKPATQP